MVLAFGVAFSALVLLVHVGLPYLTLTSRTAKLAAVAFLVGVFLAVIYLSQRLSSPLEAALLRTATGVVLGMLIAAVLGASALPLLLAAFAGGLLGYLGMAWASHI
jgi:glucose dehydrogenase